MNALAELASLPVQDAATGCIPGLRRRFNGSYAVDPWGLDADLLRGAAWLTRVRWSVTVIGAEQVAPTGPVVLVCNRRFGWIEPLVLATALAKEIGRDVRPVGCPDIDPFGTILRSFGAVPGRPDEIAGMLLAGGVIALPAGRSLSPFQAGRVPMHLLEPALEAGATLIPVAITGHELGRRWQVRVGEPLKRSRSRGPGAIATRALRVGEGLQGLLDEAAQENFWHRTRRRLPGLRTPQD